MTNTLTKLRKFNFIMGTLHLIQAVIMLSLSLTVTKVIDFKPPIWSYYLKFDPLKMTLVTDPKQIGEAPFGILVASFLFISSVAHFLIVSPRLNKTYNKDLEKGINYFRWYEYALSSSIMIVLIALLFGIYDIGALVLIFVLNASMNLFGLLMEIINQHTKKTNWLAFIFGCVPGIATWLVIALYAWGNSSPAETPWFVYAILISYFIFFNLFPINMFLQYKKVGRWSDYFYGEYIYICLSLIAKTVLAWLVFTGVMQP